MTKEEIIKGIKEGNRLALSKAITLAESSIEDQRLQAIEIIEHFGPSENTLRIGITGSPGAGKSSLIEALGSHVLNVDNQRIAVLSVDPSSSQSKGSILADKTRMTELGIHSNAFIRPSSSGSQLGGLAKNTRLAMLLCEAAGFKKIFIESVGVGQAEIEISQLVDVSVLVLSPAGGDELQGIKKGIVEAADILVVNKADGDLLRSAELTVKAYENAGSIQSNSNKNKVALVSCIEKSGIPELLAAIQGFSMKQIESGESKNRRLQQMTYLAKRTYLDILTSRIMNNESQINEALATGKLPERIALDLAKK